MTILYAVVARECCVLSEYSGGMCKKKSNRTLDYRRVVLEIRTEHTHTHTTDTEGNFPQVTRNLLSKITPGNEKMSIVYMNNVFHYIVSDGITFMCMADEASKRRVAFSFLMDIKNRWFATFGDSGKSATTFQMQHDFSQTLERQCDFFNDARNDNMERVEAQLDEVKKVMVQNISKVLDRSEHLELIADKTSQLSNTSKKFTAESKELSHAMWWHNMKTMLGISSCVVLIFVFFIMLAYSVLK